LFGPPLIRPGRDEDAAQVIALIERCWADYPGVVLHVDEEAPELRALATYYRDQGGAMWVTQDVSGMVAARPSGAGTWEVCRVYVHPRLHGQGLAGQLMDIAERHAAAQGARTLELWSDTRFGRAHRFYEKRGYLRGDRRALGDLCHSEEWHYSRPAVTPGGPAPR
jgi:GNAT superfamily N-acetyltransferase